MTNTTNTTNTTPKEILQGFYYGVGRDISEKRYDQFCDVITVQHDNESLTVDMVYSKGQSGLLDSIADFVVSTESGTPVIVRCEPGQTQSIADAISFVGPVQELLLS